MPPEPYTSQDLVDAIGNTGLEGKRWRCRHTAGPTIFSPGACAKRRQRSGSKAVQLGIPEDKAPVLRMIDDLAAGR